MRDAADAGFAVSQDEVSHGATSGLSMSGVPPQWVGNSIVWGYTADYAEYVEKGTRPHWIPLRAMPELKRWARRVLGNEGAAWAVRSKIAQEGTEAQPFVQPGIDAMKRHLRQTGIVAYIEDEL